MQNKGKGKSHAKKPLFPLNPFFPCIINYQSPLKIVLRKTSLFRFFPLKQAVKEKEEEQFNPFSAHLFAFSIVFPIFNLLVAVPLICGCMIGRITATHRSKLNT